MLREFLLLIRMQLKRGFYLELPVAYSVSIKQTSLKFFKAHFQEITTPPEQWEYRILVKNMTLEPNIRDFESQHCYSLTV